MMTPLEYRDWLIEHIQLLTEWSQPEPELNIYEDAADIVREAAEIALLLGQPNLYKETHITTPMLAIPEAKELLGRCLAVCNELIDKTSSQTSTSQGQPGTPPVQQADVVDASDGDGEDKGLPQLRMIYEKALRQYLLAEEKRGKITDEEAYEWLQDQDGSEDLPVYDTWVRYLRKAREHYSMQKNSPRAGRTGGSIVTLDEI